MIIDLILDRKDDEQSIAEGFTHRRNLDGTVEKIEYNARKFYHGVMQYINGCGDRYAEKITAAMDYGTEEEVKKALCEYITECEYNHEICDYINSREWLK